MRVHLPHIHRVTRRCADGTKAIYYYHRLTRRRIYGEPGTPEFLESYKQAAGGDIPDKGTLAGIIRRYMRSAAYIGLKPRTRADYSRHLEAIEHEFGDAPLAIIEDRRFRNLALDHREKLAERSPKQADYWWSCLRRVLSWAEDRGIIEKNVCTGGGRLYVPNRRDKVWTDENVAAFLRVASRQMRLALMLALYTAQRQGDLLRLTWKAWDGECLHVRQQKTGARVIIPAVSILRQELEETERTAVTIITGVRGRPYLADGFQAAWRKTCRKAGIKGLTFHDLRGTCISMLAEAGCTDAEIAAISGHRMRSAIMDGYMHRSEALARAAITRLETHLTSSGRVYILPVSH